MESGLLLCLDAQMPIFLVLAAIQMSPPAEPFASEIRAAIWEDIESEGMIGHGNDIAGRWLNYWGRHDEAEPPTLHIIGLVCQGNRRVQQCRFDLLRDGGPMLVEGSAVPNRIRCSAPFRRQGADWGIPHPPFRGPGHSRTTMRCEWASPS